MYNPHAEILDRFERVETLINYLINGGAPQVTSQGAIAPSKPPATRQLCAAHLGVSLPTLDKLISSGQLPTFNIGRQIRIRWSDIEAYVNKKGAPIK